MDPQDEVDSLKARLAALEGRPPSGPAPAGSPKRSGGNGCLVAFLMIAGAGAALLGLGALLPDPPATPVQDGQCDSAAAERALIATRARLVRGETVEAPDGLVIMVRPRAWARYDYDQQQKIAALYDCAIAGEGKHLAMIRFRFERSGGDLAKFDASRLLTLRQQGYAAVSSAPSPGS